MAIQVRGSRLYCYRSVWRDGRPRTEYAGAGAVALAAAAADEERRAERAKEVARLREARRRLEIADEISKDAFDLVDVILRATLAGAGWHQHARGQWRQGNVASVATGFT